jgi:hypothetical protein
VQETQAPEFHYSDSPTNSIVKQTLDANDGVDDAGEVLLIPLLSAPTVMVLATTVERRLGASAAGWLVAIPTTLPIAILAVGLEFGDRAGAILALSAAGNVGAQVAFAVAFASILRRNGAAAGLAAGAAAYSTAALALGQLPPALAATVAVPALLVGPGLIAPPPSGGATPSAHGGRDTSLACLAAVASVGGVLIAARLAGPATAGAIGAFPALSSALALVIVRTNGPGAAAGALRGLIKGLPGYLAFCVAVAAAAPFIGTLPAVPLGLAACIATCGLTWRAVQPEQAATRRPARTSSRTGG